MTDWLRGRTGAATAQFVDHSGLGAASRISAEDMVVTLVRLGPGAGLRGILRAHPMLDAKGKTIQGHPGKVVAKTGTLNFVSALAGYATAKDGTEMAFAIFTGDVTRRDAVPPAEREKPRGGVEWTKRSKRLQQQLIERWAEVYG